MGSKACRVKSLDRWLPKTADEWFVCADRWLQMARDARAPLRLRLKFLELTLDALDRAQKRGPE